MTAFMTGGISSVPDGWCVTPRKAEVPRLKPWLCRRTAMISSSKLMLSMQSIRSEYLRMAADCKYYTWEWTDRIPVGESLTEGRCACKVCRGVLE